MGFQFLSLVLAAVNWPMKEKERNKSNKMNGVEWGPGGGEAESPRATESQPI